MAKKLTGGLSKDENSAEAQVANGIQTSDATASPQNSPLTVSTAVLNLSVPVNAVSITMVSTANDVRVSEVSTASTYFLLKANVVATFPCAKQSSVYVVRDAGSDATLQFVFNIL